LPDFSWYNIPKRKENVPNDPKNLQIAFNMLTPFQGPPKYTQIDLKIYHLATRQVNSAEYGS
jgi:hypothetical protein